MDKKREIELRQYVEAFRPQIRRQVRLVARKFGKWVAGHTEDLDAYSLECLWRYVYGTRGEPNDAGMYDAWLEKTHGDHDDLAGYIGRALYGDLMNYAQTIKRKKQLHGITRHPKGKAPEVKQVNPLPELEKSHDAPLEFDRILNNEAQGEKHTDGDYTYRAPSKMRKAQESDVWERKAVNDDRVGFESWGKPVLRCPKYRNTGNLCEKGTCRHCDAKRKPQVHQQSTAVWVRHRGGASHWNWHNPKRDERELTPHEWAEIARPKAA